VCFFRSWSLCSWPLGCWVSKRINKNLISLLIWLCLSVSQFSYPFSWIWGHMWCISISCQHWLRLHDSYACLSSYVKRRFRFSRDISGVPLLYIYNMWSKWGEIVNEPREWSLKTRGSGLLGWESRRPCARLTDSHCTWDVTRQCTAVFRRLRRGQLNLSVQWVNFIQDIKACSRT
jgi:hypothetical protein